jgi:hypothetical protein
VFLEMAKRMANACDPVVKNFESVFVKKNLQIFLKQKKFLQKFRSRKKIFKKTRIKPKGFAPKQ